MKNQKGFSLIELLIVVIIIAIIAAIAIPSLLRARISANESATIGDIRTIISGNATYASANAGLHAHALTCMVTPASCIPSYPTVAPTFLDSQIAAEMIKSGYNRTYTAGSSPANVPPQANSLSVVGYVYLASPVDTGKTGVRGFGGDSSGVMCVTANGVAPTPAATNDILEPTACTVLQ